MKLSIIIKNVLQYSPENNFDILIARNDADIARLNNIPEMQE